MSVTDSLKVTILFRTGVPQAQPYELIPAAQIIGLVPDVFFRALCIVAIIVSEAGLRLPATMRSQEAAGP
jgi:hypothetical protein